MSFGLEAVGLVRSFGGLRAVDGVSFQLEPGELLTVFGPNGAGKTTLLRMLGGVMRPDSGQVRVAGALADVASRDWRHRVGIVSHQSLLYGQLTTTENLQFYGRLFGLTDLKIRIPERLESMGLSDRARTPVRELSRGLKQRVALARALLHDPEVVLLDEPYTGLDPHASAVLREQLSSLKDGRRTVVLVTHNLKQGLELADRVAIQVQGRFSSVTDAASLDLAGLEVLYHDAVENPA
ncbi:MAG: heme ABC exporter ATP-binding protein CcmA [Gemmatimonadetes bacterium]|nr:heme ABC exporter ATP-binding protein CcmA [Gemmatimonadota bacterium]